MDIDIKKLKLGLGGLAAGFVNGMLGAGGGMIAVPTLSSLGLDRKKAHANSVAVIMPLSLFSAIHQCESVIDKLMPPPS